MRRRLTSVSASLVLLCACQARSTAGLISSDGLLHEHYVATATFPDSAGSGAVTAQNFWHWTDFGFDGLDHGTSASVADSTATASHNYGDPNGESMILSRSWSLDRAANVLNGNHTSTLHRLFFKAEADLAYSIEGQIDNPRGGTYLHVALLDWTEQVSIGTPIQRLFDSRHQTTTPGFFEAGVGSDLSYFTGTPNGTLLAGRIYEFSSYASSYALAPGDEGSFATGFAKLTLTQINAVPEPGSVALFGTGSIGLVAIRRRRRTVINGQGRSCRTSRHD